MTRRETFLCGLRLFAGAAVLSAALVLPALAGEQPPEGSAESEMALIAAGEFTMGRTKTTSDDESGMRPLILRDDRPPHTVYLDAYWIDRHEVTHTEYARFVDAAAHRAPYHWPTGEMPEGHADLPIYNVDWHDAQAYCHWAGKRLPTEAEWERAARGGVEGADYPWGHEKIAPEQARYDTPEGPGTVGQHPPNGFGLYDMAGGVSEWCADWFDRRYYERSPARNPRGPEDGLYKIIRGGAWSDGPRRLRLYFRNWVRPTQRTPNIGFRCVKDAE